MTSRQITQADLDTLPPATSAVAYDWLQVRDDYVRLVQMYDPEWPADEDDLVLQACEAMAYITVANREARNAIDRDHDVTRAAGGALARIGTGEGTPPIEGEPDDRYRLRIINARRHRASTATPGGLRSALLAYRPTDADWWVSSGDVQNNPNSRWQARVAALKGEAGVDGGPPLISDLNGNELGALNAWVRSESVQPFGFAYSAVGTTRVAYTIRASLRLVPGADRGRTLDLVTDAALAWAAANDVVSGPFYSRSLQAAMGCVPGVRVLRLLDPAADVAGAWGVHHAGPRDAAGVTLLVA